MKNFPYHVYLVENKATDEQILAAIGDGRIVDVGAGTGEKVNNYLSQFPSCKVSAFEPYAPNFEAMKSRFGGKVDCINAACGALDGQSFFYVEKVGLPSDRLSKKFHENYNGLGYLLTPKSPMRLIKAMLKAALGRGYISKVPTVTLDTYFHDEINAGVEFDLVKIDVQGLEPAVLAGAERFLRNTKMLWIEYTRQNKIFTKTLRENGFKLYETEYMVACPKERKGELEKLGFEDLRSDFTSTNRHIFFCKRGSDLTGLEVLELDTEDYIEILQTDLVAVREDLVHSFEAQILASTF